MILFRTTHSPRQPVFTARRHTTPYPVRAFLGLGSNLGDRQAHLEAACDRLSALDDARVVLASPIYVTEPWGDAAQPRYLNQVVGVDLGASWTPEGLLEAALAIETAEGRVRDPQRRFGPRTLDVDILLYGETRCSRPDLIVPHPRLRERAFMLVPLADIAPEAVIADAHGGTVAQALQRIADQISQNCVRYQTVPR